MSRAASIAVAFVLFGGEAMANGRFPNAGLVALGAGGSRDTVLVQATFGVLVSHDRGRSFGWVCEESFAEPSGWDPPLAVGASGTLVIGMLDGLRTSDNGCAWSRPSPSLAVADLAWDGSHQTLLAGLTPSGEPARLAVSTDGGAHWTVRASLPSGISIDTVEVAPSRPSRMWVSTNDNNRVTPGLYRSDDSGETLVRVSDRFDGALDVYLAAVHPTRPDVLWVRGLLGSTTYLLRSDDGGASFTRVATTRQPMQGFALSDDGDTLWIASEDPAEGLQRSVRGAPFVRLAASNGTRCLRYQDGALYRCGDNAVDGVAVARSLDEGLSFEPLLRFRDLAGPLSCPSGTPTHDQCTPRWPATRALFAVDAGAVAMDVMRDDVAVDAGLRDSSIERAEVSVEDVPAVRDEGAVADLALVDTKVADTVDTSTADRAPTSDEASSADVVTLDDRTPHPTERACACRLATRTTPTVAPWAGLVTLGLWAALAPRRSVTASTPKTVGPAKAP